MYINVVRAEERVSGMIDHRTRLVMQIHIYICIYSNLQLEEVCRKVGERQFELCIVICLLNGGNKWAATLLNVNILLRLIWPLVSSVCHFYFLGILTFTILFIL